MELTRVDFEMQVMLAVGPHSTQVREGASRLILDHDAALRASHDAERERSEAAVKQFQDVVERNADLTAKLEAMTKELDQWKGFAKHRIPTHGPCCTCQRCGLDHDSCRCDLDEVCDQLDDLTAKLEAMTRERNELRDKAISSELEESMLKQQVVASRRDTGGR